MKIIAVIQARLNSTRLPRKILLPLAGKSMLQNVVERVSRAKLIDSLVVSVPQSDFIEIEKKVPEIDYSLLCSAKDENDLIGRLLEAAIKMGADAIVRVCADNPIVEPQEIDHLVQNRDALSSDVLLMNSENPRLDHDGFGGEYYTLERLHWVDEMIKAPKYREHPHKFWIDLNLFAYCGNPYPPGFRFDVNTQADYEKIKAIFDHFGHNKFSVKEAMEFLETQKIQEQAHP